MSLIRGTTPSYTVNVAGVELNKAKAILVTFGQNGKELFSIEKSDLTIDAEKSTIAFTLTQEQTLMFDNEESVAQMQIRILDISGNCVANSIQNIAVQPILHEGVLA